MKATLSFEAKSKHDSSYFNSPSPECYHRTHRGIVNLLLSTLPGFRNIPLTTSVSDTEHSLRLITVEGGQDELDVPRRKEKLTIKSPRDEFETTDVQTRQGHDPQELKIYIKQLSKALKFLPLGSRAYYAVTGELLRASTQLKAVVPTGSAMKGEH